MDKQRFLLTKEELERQIADLKNRLNDAKNEYIESNSKFKLLDRVIVTNGKGQQREVSVCGFELNYSNDVTIKAKKIKKDGSVSVQSDYIWHSEKLTLKD